MNTLRKPISLTTVCLIAVIGFAPASANDGAWLKKQIAAAKSGAVIEIPAGDYDLSDVAIPRSLTLRGEAKDRVVLRSAEVVEKGILIPRPGVDLAVENITFAGAHSWDRNGAGIRHEGRNLSITRCAFIGNEDGLLSTGAAAGVITIADSDFIDNGFGDGQSHAIYVYAAARLEISDSRFVGTRIGHHVKSLADKTLVRNTKFDDAHGRTSYAIDASKGGDVEISGNHFIQTADSDNQAIVNYDLTRGGKAIRLVLTDNRIVNDYDGGVFLRNDTRLPPVMQGNAVEDRGKRPLALTASGSPKPLSQKP